MVGRPCSAAPERAAECLPAIDDVQQRPRFNSGHEAAPCIWRLKFLLRSEEHTSELQSLMRISYAVFCLKKKNNKATTKKLTITKCQVHTYNINKRSMNTIYDI